MTEYEVRLKDGTSGLFVNATSSCTETLAQLLLTLKCTIPMDTVRTTYNYVIGQLIEAKALALNVRGWSDISETSTGTILV